MGKIAEIIKANVDYLNEAGSSATEEGYRISGEDDAESEILRLIKHKVKKELKKST